MVSRANGSAISVRIERMVAATINSSSVKPLCLRTRVPRWKCNVMFVFATRIPPVRRTLLDGHRCLCSIDRDRLQSRIASSAPRDCQRSLALCLSLESKSDHRALARYSTCPRWPRGRDLRLSNGLIVAMNQRHHLTILRQESAIGYVDQLNHLRVVVQLYWHGVNVLRAGNQQIHYKCVAFRYLNSRRIKQETCRSTRCARRRSA